MKKITLWLFALFTSWQINAQTCSQTFSAEGQDDGPTVLTINAADLNCYGTNPLTGLTLKNAAGSLTSGNCSTTGGGWFGFDLSIDGGTPVTGCAAAFNDLDVTGFTTLTITSADNDDWSDTVTITIDVEATFTPLSVPDCVSLSSPANDAINVSSSVISWPAAGSGPTGYSVSVGTDTGLTDILELEDVGNVLTYNLGPLEPGTTYYVTITPYNANGEAEGCMESNFTTCDAFGVPFAEEFNSTSSTKSCWSVLNVNGDADTWNLNYATSPIEGDQSAMMFTDFNAGVNDDYLISPKITLTGNQRLVFKYKVQSAGEPNDFAVLLSTTGTSPADFTTTLLPLASYSNTVPASHIITLDGISGDVHFAWHVPAGGLDGWRLYIDEVVVEDIPMVAPSCVAITAPVNEAIDVLNSTITWASNIDATGYSISVGTEPGQTDILELEDVGNVLTYNLATEPGTTYYVTVFPYNNFGEATGCDEISFTTCDAISAPHLEQFNTFLPGCWQEADNGDLVTGPATFGTSIWTEDGFGNVGTTGAMKINIDYLNDNDWVISPVVEIPATGFELKFDAAVTQWNTTAAPTTPWEADDRVEVLVSTEGFTNWTVLYTYDNTNVPATTGTVNIINLDAYASEFVRFAYRGIEGLENGGADVDFFVDNFEIRETPALAPACATNIVATPDAACGNFASELTWDASEGADGYYISIGTTAGGNEIVENEDLGNVLTYSFVGTLNTEYFYTIVPYNVIGAATDCAEMSFITFDEGCYCTPTYTFGVTDGDLISNIEIVGTTLSNNTGNEETGPSYTFYTGQPNYTASLQAGSSYDISVTVGSFGSQNLAAWIDYNDNYIFEPSERIGFTTASIAANGTASFPITLACNPPLGDHRLRIRDVFFTTGNLIDPCTNYGYGETEDYVVTITTADACPTPSALTATMLSATGATLGWNIGCSEIVWDVHVDLDGTPAPTTTISHEAISTNPLVLTDLTAETAYQFYVRANCGGMDGTSTWAGPFLFSTLAFPPANDECANAVALTVNADLACGVVTAGTTVAATDSGVEPGLDITGTPNNDVWYSFVATNTAHSISLLNVTAVVGTSTDMGIGLFNGPCEALTLVGSSDPNSYSVSGLTVGNTYLVNVYGWGTTNSAQANFDICVGTPPAPPANDDCENAVALTVNADYSCGVVTSGTTVSATDSGVEPGLTITGTPNNDVWFSFVATNTAHSISLLNVTAVVGTSTDMGIGLFNGPCEALTLVGSSDPNSYSVSGLTVGNTYLVNVYGWAETNSAQANFDICVGTPPAPPANDDCANAVALTVNADYLCGEFTSGTTVSATDSGVEPGLTITGTPNNDVWYSFEATQTAHRITLTNVVAVVGTSTDMGIGLFNGPCEALTLVGSSDPNTYNVTGLTVGNTYLVNVYGWAATNSAQANFDICVGTDPALSSDYFDNANFLAYPNPVKDVLNLSYSSEISNVRVINLLGQEVVSRAINATSTQIDMSQLSAGAYIVNVTVGDTIKTIKVVKQ